MNTSPSLLGALDADPLASVRGHGSALANLAFGSMSRTVITGASQGRDLAFLPIDALELDLTDPAQRRFGDYELLELIGEGGMGVVYRARQASLDRDVAVKLLAAGPWASKEFVERFRREAQNAARMQHPNIVAIYEVGSAEELHFFSMRLIEGPSLAAVVKREGRLPAARAATLMRTIAEAVDYAHRLGVLHLDLKPANVLLDEDGAPHVADFGLARRLDDGLAADSDEVSGTPSYMAPEQATAGARRITTATDIWGLGAILYELVTGQPPFLGESPHATLKLVVEGALRSPRRHVDDLPRDLDAIILKCMRRNVAERYPTARALADDLSLFVEGREVRARPLNTAQRAIRWARREPRLAGTALLALAALLLGLSTTTQQWRRANANAMQSQANAATSSERLWESRRDAALRLQQDGKGFEALPPLLANIEEQERAGKTGATSIERHEVGAILNQGVVLINRMHLANAQHSSPFAAELSPDGSRFAIAMTDQTVHWYATDTLKELGHVDLLGLADSTDRPELPVLLRFVGNHRLRVTLEWFDFFTAPGDNNTFLIDLDANGIVPFPDDFKDLSDATFSADGRYAVLRNRIDKIQFWQVDPWKPLSPLVEKGLDREITLLSRDGHELIGIGNGQSTLNFYDPHTLAPTAHIALPPTEGLSAWAQSSDGNHLAFGDFQGRVFVLDMTTRKLRQLPTPNGREVTWVAFSEDDAWLGAVRWDGAAYAFDVATGNPLNAGQMQHDFELRRVAINHRERLLIASGLGKSGLWRLPNPGPTTVPSSRIATSPMRGANAGPYSLGFCATTGTLITAETDGEIRLWRAPATPVVDARTARLIPGMFEYDGKHIVDVAYNKLRILTLATGESTPWFDMPQPLSFAELIDGGRTLIAASGTQLTVFDGTTMQPRYAPVELDNSPMRLVASATSNTIVLSFPEKAAVGFAERLESLDLRSGKRQAEPVTVAGPLRQLELSPDGTRLLATGSAPAPTQVFDARALKQIGAYTFDAETLVTWAHFGPGDNILSLLTRARDERLLGGNLVSWDPAAGATVATRKIDGALPVGSIAVARKSFVAGNGFDVLDPGMPDERRTPTPSREETTAALAVSHDGRLVAHAFRYNVQIYDAQSGEAIGPPLHADLLSSIDVIGQLAFAPDDRQLLARTIHGAWVVWPITMDARALTAMRQEAELINATSDRAILQDRALILPQRDPGMWRTPTQRQQPPIARLVEGDAIPARSIGTSPLLLDLTTAYDTAPESVSNTMHSLVPSMNLMPLGIVRIEGIDYDLRGTVQTHQTTRAGIIKFFDSTKRIDVPATPVSAFRVLMMAGTFIATPDGYEQARLRIHYRDGSSAWVPLRSGFELPGDPLGVEPVSFGWVWGDHLRLMGYEHQHLFNNPRLPNPHPERLVATVDLQITGKAPATPVIFSITAEPVIAAANSGIGVRKNPAASESEISPRRNP